MLKSFKNLETTIGKICPTIADQVSSSLKSDLFNREDESVEDLDLSCEDHTEHDENLLFTIKNRLKSNGKKGPPVSSDMASLVNMMLSCNINSDIAAKRKD